MLQAMFSSDFIPPFSTYCQALLSCFQLTLPWTWRSIVLEWIRPTVPVEARVSPWLRCVNWFLLQWVWLPNIGPTCLLVCVLETIEPIGEHLASQCPCDPTTSLV